ncbi:MAG: glycerophosphodiester phosphodiesterase [Nocardioides sp.]|uniref:glycerophosphodiester phosphodiesterase n=1 Tax=Nocardioides sp. TaxID=35761 RepID=UPI003F1153E8
MTSPPPSRSVLAFAHRGGAYHPEIEGLENTLTAFQHAWELGYRHMETDVHVTADGVLLAFHDDVLDRVTDRLGAVADLTLEQVREARIGGRAQVPTLAELVEALPGASFNIDLKSEASVGALHDFIEERCLHDRILVGSFSGRRLAAFRRLTRGRVRTSAAALEVVAYRFSPTAWAARLLTRGRPVALQVPHHHRGMRVVTPGLVRRAHANGVQVHVWTIDDPDEMRELIDRGVDGIMTDRTDILRGVLSENGLWEESA